MTVEEKAQHLTVLYGNKSFQELILKEFIDQDILGIVLKENVDSDGVRDQLKARQIITLWFSGIISDAEIAKQEKKG